jgi:hypothetical protein
VRHESLPSHRHAPAQSHRQPGTDCCAQRYGYGRRDCPRERYAGATASAGATPSATPGGSIPAGWTQHDVDARNAVRRYLGNLVPALNGIYGPAVYAKLGEILASRQLPGA